MVDDFKNIGFLKTGDGLGGFVVIHKYHTLSSRPHQMVSGEDSHNLIVFIQNRITGFPVFQHHFLYVIHLIRHMETYQIPGRADSADRGGLENESGCLIGIAGCIDDAGGCFDFLQLGCQFCPAENHAVYILFQSLPDHIGLIAADNDTVAARKYSGSSAFGNGKDDFTGYGIQIFACFVDDFPFQYGQNIEQRHFVQYTGIVQFHVVACDIFSGDQT